MSDAEHALAPTVLHRLEAARAGGSEAADLLRDAGCRPTAQRLVILQAVAAGDHVSADDVLAHASSQAPTITPSTVYRTLEALVDAGLVLRTDLGDERLYYEIAREHRHHHAVCQECGAIAHLHDPALAPLEDALRSHTGYRLTPDRELTIPGLCPDCQKGSGRAHP